MALVNIESVRPRIVAQLKKTPEGQGFEILSYKRNRGITLVRTGTSSIHVTERGYRERKMTVTFSILPRVLRAMMNTEFPRSRKVRVYRLSCAEAAGREMKKLQHAWYSLRCVSKETLAVRQDRQRQPPGPLPAREPEGTVEPP